MPSFCFCSSFTFVTCASRGDFCDARLWGRKSRQQSVLCSAVPARRLSKLGVPLERCARSYSVAQDLISLQTGEEACRMLQGWLTLVYITATSTTSLSILQSECDCSGVSHQQHAAQFSPWYSSTLTGGIRGFTREPRMKYKHTRT